MWNVFEQPWLLTVIAVGSFLLVGTLISAFPKTFKPWTRIIPVLILLAAFGLDYGVETDHEKIMVTLNQLVETTQNQDVPAIEQLIATDYQDSYHRSKDRLIGHIKSRFSKPVLEKIKKLSLYEDSRDSHKATAALNATVIFDSNSSLAQFVGKSVIVRVEFTLSKQPQGNWLLSNMELVEVNKQPVNWRHAAGQF